MTEMARLKDVEIKPSKTSDTGAHDETYSRRTSCGFLPQAHSCQALRLNRVLLPLFSPFVCLRRPIRLICSADDLLDAGGR
ncbi:hypothetical protein cyc_00821 [Cyclospora cayetanensis]|uniref:Uncharacterized protein n=1 Tax=Cyclospora cayetanensis TaxID=88456 RepID=A0A1D3CT43_9EIME|nr:hypothetical protein cyc_00821 [Cyclospora cayetanensis]